ncbi:hypothetical protein [Bradyrhizobium sp. 143]|uniref:hypothetical protein n=1 Tax=unclassified Bradyrhizobium TaxID=2631580 RepID=UPI003208F8B1
MMFLVRSLILFALLCPCQGANAQDYPTRPVTMIVPFSAGGPGDVIARILGNAMSATLKQSIVIENVVGPAARSVPIGSRRPHPMDTRCS